MEAEDATHDAESRGPARDRGGTAPSFDRTPEGADAAAESQGAPPAAPADRIGLVRRDLGDGFEVLRTLGKGSGATVYLARDRVLDRPVAIKVMTAEAGRDEVLRKRFEREARAAASLSSHPRIVSVHSFGHLSDGSPYLVMQYVKGRTMAERVASEGEIPLNEGLRALRDAAEALTVAHARDIAHRDVRPGNILWDAEADHALLTDFGIAALLAPDGQETTRLTQTGQLLGDVRFLSPEQLLDQEITELVDIYALGVTAYHILAGEGPYQARSNTEMIQAHLKQEPRALKELRREVPETVSELFGRCLAREPNHRPAASVVLRALEDVLGSRTGAGVVPGDSEFALLIRKRVPQVVVVTAGLGYGFTEWVSTWIENDLVRGSAYTASLVLAATGVALSGIVAWFHGERGRQRAPAVEFVLLAVVAVTGLALASWVFLRG